MIVEILRRRLRLRYCTAACAGLAMRQLAMPSGNCPMAGRGLKAVVLSFRPDSPKALRVKVGGKRRGKGIADQSLI